MARIDDVRNEVLELHRLLIEEERRAYERLEGKTSPGQLLELLVSHASFAWLRPLTAFLVELDDVEEDALEGELDRVRDLLQPDGQGAFQRRYGELLQQSPDLAVAHGATMRVLRKLPPLLA